MLFSSLILVAGATLAAPEEKALLHNVAAVELVGAGDEYRISRVPLEVIPELNRNAQLRAWSPAGVEIRFNLRGESAKIELRMIEDRAARTRGAPVLAEIRFGDHLWRTHAVTPEWTTIAVRRPAAKLPERPGRHGFDPQLVRLILPYAVEIRLRPVAGDIAPARPEQLPATRYLAYGSSITHGYDCVHPGETYPALLARRRGWDAINLGFGAGAHLEPAMARWIARRDGWDVATLELGVNLLRIEEQEFRKRVREFLRIVAEARPDNWIFVIDIFRSGRDYADGAKQRAFRRIVHEAVAELARPRVVHLDGLELLRDPRGLSVDLLHPSPDGFREIAERLDQAITPYLGPAN